jgi:hypothetical protein
MCAKDGIIDRKDEFQEGNERQSDWFQKRQVSLQKVMRGPRNQNPRSKARRKSEG